MRATQFVLDLLQFGDVTRHRDHTLHAVQLDQRRRDETRHQPAILGTQIGFEIAHGAMLAQLTHYFTPAMRVRPTAQAAG
jgi:hypothetical protein